MHAYIETKFQLKMICFINSKKLFNQIWLLLLSLLLFLPFGHAIIDRSKLPKQPKCAYTFLTESAICSHSNSLAEISQEFRLGWKHIKVVSSTGTFSIEGISVFISRDDYYNEYIYVNRSVFSLLFFFSFFFYMQILMANI